MGKSDVPGDGNGKAKLPARQEEALKLLLKGQAVKEIASSMRLSPHTVRDYIKSIYKHYEVTTRGELFALWVKD